MFSTELQTAGSPTLYRELFTSPVLFDAVTDGQINLTPNETAYNAARDALNGWDPTYGCIYYYNPATATSKWIWSRPIVVKIESTTLRNNSQKCAKRKDLCGHAQVLFLIYLSPEISGFIPVSITLLMGSYLSL